jgi:hypothetical protein
MKQSLNWKQIVLGLLIGIGTIIFIAHCDSTPPKSDKELYLIFYKDIMSKVKAFDEGYTPFINAVSKGKAIKAIGIAIEIDQPIRQLWLNIDRISVPDLKNKDVQDELTKAKKLISYAYLSKCEAISAYIEYSKNPSPYSLAIIENKVKDVQSQLFIGMGYLISSGAKLELQPNEITSH